MRRFGIHRSHGYSSEARVFANRLRLVDDRLEMRLEKMVVFQPLAAGGSDWRRFERGSGARVVPLDMGRGPNADWSHPRDAKAASAVQFYSRRGSIKKWGMVGACAGLRRLRAHAILSAAGGSGYVYQSAA
jgi:hypothetical protein